MPPKKEIKRANVEDIATPEVEPQATSIFPSATNQKPKKESKSSPKSNMATVGTEPILEPPKKERKSSPKSNMATVGTEPILEPQKKERKSSSKSKEPVLKSSASDSSSDVGSSDLGSSNKGTWGTASSTGTPAPGEELEEEIEQWQYKNILTPYDKSQDNFQIKLASLTRSDAHHDLKKVFNDTSYWESNVRKAYNSGIPKEADVTFHELEAFASIVISATDSKGKVIQINDKEDKLTEALSVVPNCTDGYNGEYSTFEVGIDTNTPLFKFKVVQFITKCSNNSEFKNPNFNLVELACKSNFGKSFVENTKLGEDNQEAAIIVDFTQHGFVEGLTEGEESNFTIHYLMTPEVVNDPAGKPNVTNKSLFGKKNTGVKLISYVEETNDVTAYTKFDENDPNTSNNFFSNYDFTLSPIKKIITNQKAEKLITTLNIKYDTKDKSLTDSIEDSKGENSIKTVTSYLKKIIEQVKVKFDIATAFNFNSKIQQKRGGDWFQALACINARNRNYNQILPTQSTKSIKLNPNCPVYLVTHDRIAVTFALLNGVNVIYLDYYGRIYVFKNSSDKTLKG